MPKTPKDMRRIKYQRTHRRTEQSMQPYPDDILQGIRVQAQKPVPRMSMRSLLLSILSMSMLAMSIDMPRIPIPVPSCFICDSYPDDHGDNTP